MPDLYDVVVIGAGISGLTAASELLRLDPGCRLLVLEAKDRVGGRTLMAPMKVAGGEEANFDLGGMWVGPTQRHISSLLDELGIQTYPQYLGGTKIAEMGAKVAQYSGDIPRIGLLGMLDMGKVMVQLERYARNTSADDPGQSASAEYHDSVSGEALINSIAWSANSKFLMAAAVRTIWGADASRMSALYMLSYAKAAGSFQSLTASDASSGQGFRLHGCAHSVSQLLAERLGHERLRLDCPVLGIDQSAPDGPVSVLLADQSELLAKAVICTAPPHLVAQLQFRPPLPADHLEFCKASQVGHLTKFIVTYETAFWRELGFSGEIVSAGGQPTAPGCSMAPISVCFDYSINDDRHPALVAFSGGTQARELDSLAPQQRRDAVLAHLARFFPEEKVYGFVDFAEKNWRDEPYCGGCPVDIVATGGARFAGPSSRAAFGRVAFAGTETATEWRGYMDGAVQSGRRAAAQTEISRSSDGNQQKLSWKSAEAQPEISRSSDGNQQKLRRKSGAGQQRTN